MAVYKRGDTWWFKFVWRGELIRESTKQGNKRVAEQIEAARKTQKAKGEVGIKDRVLRLLRWPSTRKLSFLPHVEANKKDKPQDHRLLQKLR